MKLTKHAWILWGIALVAALALMIVIPFVRTTAWWIAAIGTVLMFGVCAFTFYRAFRKEDSLESKVLGWPIFRVGYTFLAAQLVLGFVLMAASALCPVWLAAVLELVLFAAAAFCLTVKDAAREVVVHSEAAVMDRTAGWKAIRAKASALAASAGSAEMRKLAETIRYADPTPTSMDSEISAALDALRQNPDDGAVRSVLRMMEERAALAKAEK